MNTYDMLKDLRANCGEKTASHWTDKELLAKLNRGQNKINMEVSMSPSDWLVTSASVTPSSSVITLPADCAKPVYLEETTSGKAISFNSTVRERRVTRASGTSLELGALEAYTLMSTIEVNQSSYGTACTLWYQIRVPDLHTGTASAGSAQSITLDTTDGIDETGLGARAVDDYYNNMEIEIVTGTGSPSIVTISDYTGSTRVATTNGTDTYDSTSVYGLVSRLPVQTHQLIVLEATTLALAKPSSSLDPKYYEYFKEEKKAEWMVVNRWLTSRVAGSNSVRQTEVL